MVLHLLRYYSESTNISVCAKIIVNMDVRGQTYTFVVISKVGPIQSDDGEGSKKGVVECSVFFIYTCCRE